MDYEDFKLFVLNVTPLFMETEEGRAFINTFPGNQTVEEKLYVILEEIKNTNPYTFTNNLPRMNIGLTPKLVEAKARRSRTRRKMNGGGGAGSPNGELTLRHWILLFIMVMGALYAAYNYITNALEEDRREEARERQVEQRRQVQAAGRVLGEAMGNERVEGAVGLAFKGVQRFAPEGTRQAMDRLESTGWSAEDVAVALALGGMAVKAAADVLPDVASGVRSAAGKASAAVGSAAGSVAEAAGSVRSAVGSAVGRASSAVGSAAGSVAEAAGSVRSAAGAASVRATGVVHSAYEGALGLVHRVASRNVPLAPPGAALAAAAAAPEPLPAAAAPAAVSMLVLNDEHTRQVAAPLVTPAANALGNPIASGNTLIRFSDSPFAPVYRRENLMAEWAKPGRSGLIPGTQTRAEQSKIYRFKARGGTRRLRRR